ncbi:primosome assembly protein PriA, partial [Streptomyces sp. SID10244]|nr:primosome assembly protein PriA [Streptomyces sp. SID10244]
LCRAVADRYAGTMSDVVRLAVPPRHARTEKEDTPVPASSGPVAMPDTAAWTTTYSTADSFLASMHSGHPRAIWQATPGEDWPSRLAELAATAAAAGRGAILVVPD